VTASSTLPGIAKIGSVPRQTTVLRSEVIDGDDVQVVEWPWDPHWCTQERIGQLADAASRQLLTEGIYGRRMLPMKRSSMLATRVLAATAALALVVSSAGCGDKSSDPDAASTSDLAADVAAGSDSTATTQPSEPSVAPDSESADLSSGFQLASWGDNVTVTYEDGMLRYVSDGLPNHERDAQYAVPDGGVMVPDASTASATADPTVAQSYDYLIPLTPTKATDTTPTSLGVIGVMISGASLFNPYEGDGATVATQSNFSVKDAAGNDVWFLDDCAGHPTPMGQYHYHALPKCVTATVDETDGASHIIGIAFDGYPIYGDRDINGQQLTAGDLDECNGITSATPEFPDGVYHYVLLDVADSTSSIRCFTGVVDSSLTAMAGMPGMGGPPPGP
jgi:hypothetical protein